MRHASPSRSRSLAWAVFAVTRALCRAASRGASLINMTQAAPNGIQQIDIVFLWRGGFGRALVHTYDVNSGSYLLLDDGFQLLVVDVSKGGARQCLGAQGAHGSFEGGDALARGHDGLGQSNHLRIANFIVESKRLGAEDAVLGKDRYQRYSRSRTSQTLRYRLDGFSP